MTKEERLKKRREYYRTHRERILEYQKTYNANHKDLVNKRKLKYKQSHNKFCIYKFIEISTNELAYIGSTNNHLIRNMNRKSQPRVKFDFIYSQNPDNFKFEIIQEVDTREEAYEIENNLIKQYQPKFNINCK